VVFDWPELVTIGQISSKGDFGGDVLFGVHNIVSLTQTVDGGLE